MKANELEKELNKQLRLYAQEIDNEVKKSADKVTKQAVQELKKDSPERTGDYAKSWTRRKQGTGYVIYNKKYQLTHLLEYGHVVISWGENRGHTGKHVHIRPIEQKTINKFNKMIEDAIK